jgi:hypothetical protein
MTSSSNSAETATGEELSKESLWEILEQAVLWPESPNLGEAGQAILRAARAGDAQAAFRFVRNANEAGESVRLALILVVAFAQAKRFTLARAVIKMVKYPPYSYGRFLALLAIARKSYGQESLVGDHDLWLARDAARWLGNSVTPSDGPLAFIDVWRWVTRGRLDIDGDPDLDEARKAALALKDPEMCVNAHLQIAAETGLAWDYLDALKVLELVPAERQGFAIGAVMNAITNARNSEEGVAGHLVPAEVQKLTAGARKLKQKFAAENGSDVSPSTP